MTKGASHETIRFLIRLVGVVLILVLGVVVDLLMMLVGAA